VPAQARRWFDKGPIHLDTLIIASCDQQCVVLRGVLDGVDRCVVAAQFAQEGAARDVPNQHLWASVQKNEHMGEGVLQADHSRDMGRRLGVTRVDFHDALLFIRRLLVEEAHIKEQRAQVTQAPSTLSQQTHAPWYAARIDEPRLLACRPRSSQTCCCQC
jgi:hypothetical protein